MARKSTENPSPEADPFAGHTPMMRQRIRHYLSAFTGNGEKSYTKNNT